jgi:hypothetical protein
VTDTNSVVSLFGFLSASMSKPPPCIVDADIVYLQEVAPASFEEDFSFMEDLGYDGRKRFKKDDSGLPRSGSHLVVDLPQNQSTKIARYLLLFTE